MLVASLSSVDCIKKKSHFKQNQTSAQNLSYSQANKLEKVLIEFRDFFVGQDGILGHINVVEHTIDTGESKT